MRLAKVLGAIGRVCITAGVLILLFVAYQLWGTGIREAQAQNDLESEFEEVIGDDADDGDVTSTIPPGDTTDSTDPAAGTGATDPPPPPPAEGDAMAQIRIPAIDVDKIVVEGVQVSDLKRGPGHYPNSPLPGQPGNAAIAGHRTTYGAPFRHIDELHPGDRIVVDMPDGRFVYRVEQTKIVDDQDLSVLDPVGYRRLMLSACHPLYSAAQRIIVYARQVRREEPTVK